MLARQDFTKLGPTQIMVKTIPSEPLSQLETELIELLKRHETGDKLIHEYLIRMRAVVALQEVAKTLGRPLNRDERKRAHVQFMDGKTTDQIVALLSQAP